MQEFRFPFAAIIGQDEMKRALLLNIIDPKIGGVLLTGEQGTGKSTAVRSLTELLPTIQVNEGCQFQCDVESSDSDKEMWCDYCRKTESSHHIISKPINLVNLPLGATEEMVTGSLDIQKILKDGERAIQPGLLAKAHKGILYIDEINLLQDHLVDLLLDVAASGVNIIEREGISLSHPSSFVLIGSMNPEEGELRPQISDRLGLEVLIRAPSDVKTRAEISKRVIEFHDDPAGFSRKFAPETQKLKEKLSNAVEILPEIMVPDKLFDLTARLVLKIGLYSQRADITFIRCVRAQAAFEGRAEIQKEDLGKSIDIAFQHRVKRFNHDIPLAQIRYFFEEIWDEMGGI